MNPPAYKYTDAIRELYRIPVDCNAVLIIEGDPNNASYEWRIEGGSQDGEHSNCGYGMPEIALRDGLIAYFGAPDQVAP